MSCPSTSREISSRMSPCSILILTLFNALNWWYEQKRGRHSTDSRLQFHKPGRDLSQQMPVLGGNATVSCVSSEPFCSRSPSLLLPSILLFLERERMRDLKFWGRMSLPKSEPTDLSDWVWIPPSLGADPHKPQRSNSWIPGWWHLTHNLFQVCAVLVSSRALCGAATWRTQFQSSGSQGTGRAYSQEAGLHGDCSTLYWLVLWVSLTQASVIKEEGAPVEEIPPWDSAVRHIFN